MSTPILVIHGAANRDPAQFSARVADLGALVGGQARLIPVFWGDIGGPMPGIVDTIPEVGGAGDAAEPGGPASLEATIGAALLGGIAGPSAPGGAPRRAGAAGERDAGVGRSLDSPRASRSRASVLADAAAAELAGGPRPVAADLGPGARRPPDVDQDAFRRAIDAAWADATWLPLVGDEAVLAAIGQEVGRAVRRATVAVSAVAPAVPPPGAGAAIEAGPPGEAAVARGIDLGPLVGGLVGGFDRVVGSLVGGIGGTVNQLLRERILPATVTGIGDVLMYQRHRDEVIARVRAVLDADAPGFGTQANPIAVAGHSLGGIIAFDASVATPPLWIRHLVTFGSQSSALHVFDPRAAGLAAYVPGHPVALPGSIGAWTNLWEPLDFLAFIVHKVFALAGGVAPTDRMAPHRAADGLWTHDDYWTHPALVDALRAAAAG